MAVRFRTTVASEGFLEEDGELWAPDGTLVAHSRQLGLILSNGGSAGRVERLTAPRLTSCRH